MLPLKRISIILVLRSNKKIIGKTKSVSVENTIIINGVRTRILTANLPLIFMVMHFLLVDYTLGQYVSAYVKPHLYGRALHKIA
jgi:hypothetical protein